MRNFTIWEIKNYADLEEVIGYLDKNKIKKNCIDWEDGPLITAVKDLEGFKYSEVSTETMANSKIKYIFFSLNTERAKREEHWEDESGNLRVREERINIYESEIIIFENNSKIYSLVYASSSRAGVLLRDLMGKDSLEEKKVDITEDLLYWIFKKVIDSPGEPLTDSSMMYITGLSSYMGKTKDNNHAIRGDGNRIAAILGTIAFLFHNESLKAVRPEIQYEGHTFLVELRLTGTYRIWEDQYQGSFMDLDTQKEMIKVSLYTYLVLIPKLIGCYVEDCDNEYWSSSVRKDFIKRLGIIIKERVQTELDKLQSQSKKGIDPAEEQVDEIEDDDCELFQMELIDEEME